MKNSDIKYYVIDTSMTSSIYIRFQQKFSDSLPCFIVEPENINYLHKMFYEKDNLSCKFLICGSEISADKVIKYLKEQEVEDKNIFLFSMPDYRVFDFYINYYKIHQIINEAHSIDLSNTKYTKSDYIRQNYRYLPDNMQQKIELEKDEYYTELCYEFFYNFVKPLHPDKRCPKIKVIDKINGFLHLKNSTYELVSQSLFRMAFGISFFNESEYIKTKLENLKQFTYGFGGAYILPYNFHRDNFRPYDDWGTTLKGNRMVYKDLHYKSEKDKYLDFLDRAKYVFCMYHDDKTNTCYVVKNIEVSGNTDFSYTVDNKKYCYLNCIKVPQWLYDTPREELNFAEIMKIKNIDIRTEAIKKYGMERLVEYGKLIDSYENYPDNEWWAKSEYKIYDMHELLPPQKVINKRTNRVIREEYYKYAPFLYMKNQTTGVYHLEGIDPKCKTLYHAIKMRYNELDLPKYKIENIK